MTRKLFKLSSVVSLLLCGATLKLWTGSYQRPGTWHRQHNSTWSEVSTTSGRIYWIKAAGVVVQSEELPLSNWAVVNLPRKRWDDWATGYLPDRCFFQFPGDGRLITSEKSLLPILEQTAVSTRDANFLGVKRVEGNIPGRLSFQELIIPYALILVICSTPLLAMLAALVRRLLLRERSRRWVLMRRCRRCGYDIRVTVDRCSECGEPVLSTEAKLPRSLHRLRH
jgi:hypothetical protein